MGGCVATVKKPEETPKQTVSSSGKSKEEVSLYESTYYVYRNFNH